MNALVKRLRILAAATAVVLLAGVSGSAGAAEPTPFAIKSFTMQTTGPTEITPLHHLNGRSEEYEFANPPESFTQAGGHPWALTTAFEVTSRVVEQLQTAGEVQFRHVPVQDVKDAVATLPAGLLGDPMAVPRCPLATALAFPVKLCPAASQIGVFRWTWFGGKQFMGPIVDVVPEAGQSAEFVFQPRGATPAVLTAHLVHIGEGYGFTVTSNNIPGLQFVHIETTFWGVPADPSHDPMRGLSCSSSGWDEPLTSCEGGGQAAGVAPVPFLSMPSDCSAGPETASLRLDSWENAGTVGVNGQYSEQWKQKTATLPAVTGCENLAFHPEIEAQPDTLLADEPVGLGVNLKVPQFEEPERLATPHLRDAVVTLPLGMSVSPGVVDGIQACEATGPEGINITGPESEQIAVNGEWQLAPGHCPDASTVGTAEAITPLLPEPVKGHVYLAKPGCGGAGQAPCSEADALDGNLYKLYLELGGKGALGNAGIEIKVEGDVEADPATGQLTAKFLENPQTPFSELKVDLNGGPRAPLDNPATCGSALTSADLTPWSEPGITPEGVAVAGTPDAAPSSFFDVEGCSNPTPFAPGFLAGTVTSQAGAFSAFTLNLARHDREQDIKGIQVHTPPGLLGMLSSVPLCQEPAADAGTCPESARIGTARVASGAGSHPFEIEGEVYLTGPYGGSPFGLSIVTHAIAGPFNLGLVIVRARIAVDPTTSALTITADESGPRAIPQIVFGVPLRLQRITVNVDRPGFMFNPTRCANQSVTATISGSENATAQVSSPFAAAGCRSLAFKPGFTATTSGRTSRLRGASLDVKVAYPPFQPGREANIAYVKVELPRQLPSRLPTLQKACAASVFEADPANCPPQSVIGIARTSTPVLPVQLSGPVYFVSHGGEAFPSLIVVLQGDGVRVDLTGSTFISHSGITSSTFKTVPDVPIESFELYLPEGPYSALAANTNLCNLSKTVTAKHRVTRRVHGRVTHSVLLGRVKRPASLSMPTEIVAQNGAAIHQSTKIAVLGCPTPRAHAATVTRGRHR